MPVHAAITHDIPGRLRLRFSEAKGQGGALSSIAEHLAEIDGVETVQINPITGTILLIYDPALSGHVAETIQSESLASELFTLNRVSAESATVDAGQSAAASLDERSTSAVLIKKILRSVDAELRQATGNKIDLGVLVPLTAGLAAVGKSRSAEGTPLWLTLGIFAFQSFLALNRGVSSPNDPDK